MAFRVPVFNISVNIWNNPAIPPGPASLTLLAQLRQPKAQAGVLYPDITGSGVLIPAWELLIPVGTDIRDEWSSGIASYDVVEAPAGTGRFYTVALVDDVARGFTNQYRLAYLMKTVLYGFWGPPIP